jgi:hypothetical protein
MCPPITRRTRTTHYLLSVHSVEGEARDPMTEEEMRQFMERVRVLEEEEVGTRLGLRRRLARSRHRHGRTRVRRRGADHRRPICGVEGTSRQLYVIEAEDLDAALAWASKTTAVVSKPIEVRPFRHVSEA